MGDRGLPDPMRENGGPGREPAVLLEAQVELNPR
jgi:hypothetical protein